MTQNRLVIKKISKSGWFFRVLYCGEDKPRILFPSTMFTEGEVMQTEYIETDDIIYTATEPITEHGIFPDD